VNVRSLWKNLAVAAALLAAAGAARGLEEKSLLAGNGTVYTVRAGTFNELTTTAYIVSNNDSVIQWSARTQDGSRIGGTVPGSAGASTKKNIQLAYDETTGALIVLWKEEVSVLNVLHLGILRGYDWTISDLLPGLGFPHTFNPQMVLTHQTVHYTNSDGNDATRVRPILSVLWWEEASSMTARYAPIFLDETSSPDDVKVYDLPALIGSSTVNSDFGQPASVYQYPSLRADGSNGEIAVSFADLAARKSVVLRITFPDGTETPTPGTNPDIITQRRRIPVVGVKFSGPTPDAASLPTGASISTLIGPSYTPTLFWSDASSVSYVRTDGKSWSAVRSIPITADLPYDRAMRLVEEMANRN
jgi:hypothetical protein